MNHRYAGVMAGTLFAFFLLIFIGMVVLVLLNPEGSGMESMIDTMRNTLIGNIILILPGAIATLMAIVLVMIWFSYQKHRDLRYKMAFYLYHSKVQKDDAIPLGHLARVAVCNTEEITATLERMIDNRELKGEIEQEKGLYIHKGLTKRTMRILTALPPARTTELDDVKRYALEGAAAQDREDDGIEELEEYDIEELPSVTDEIHRRKGERKIPCPECGRMNRRSDHFCTYCGEVIG